jgi:hypothetical protein
VDGDDADRRRRSAGAALESWMSTHEGFDSCGVEVRWLGAERGYGGVANATRTSSKTSTRMERMEAAVSSSRGVTAGDVLVRVPRAAMLTSEEARDCPDVGAACRSLSEWRALILKLLHERDVHLGLRAVSDAGGSRWGPWIDMLPEVEEMRDGYPLLWNKERRTAYLQGSPTLYMLDRLLEVGGCWGEFVTTFFKRNTNTSQLSVASRV